MANILVVDDDQLILKVVSLALNQVGHSVATALDGHTAWEALQEEYFDLVISDISMPHGVTGFQLTRRIREDAKLNKLPILMMSGRNDLADVERAIESGADDYIIKPIDIDIFHAKVEALLESHRRIFAFSDTPTQISATWKIDLTVTGVSEQGIRLISSLPLPLSIKTRIEIPIFDEIRIKPPLVRVSTCKLSTEEKNKYELRMLFIGVPETDLQKVRRWVMTHFKKN